MFETVEQAPSWWLGFQQTVQEPTFLLGEAPDDQLEQARMDERPHSTNQTVQRAEGGQFEALAHQFLDGDVDQISRMVLYLGRLADRLGMTWAIASIGALTVLSGIIVAFVMYETHPAKGAPDHL